ncbi:MAG: hypothetical protein M3O02_03975 [Acidobacteriota bacterium]|nr:hypothetical protein [Acidobacteriota bacterium]
MKKVVVASLLACAAFAPAVRSSHAQQPVALGSGGAAAPCQMPDAEYKPYTDALAQTDPKAKAAAITAYLAAFPQSACPATRTDMLVILMATYSQFDAAKTLETADKVLQLDPGNLRALTFQAYLRKQSADALTDPTAKQAALDAAASAAQKGLVAAKPASMSDADYKTLQNTAFPIFYSSIATAALNKKDTTTAVENFTKELSAVPADQTTKPGPILQDTYFLALAYLQSTPPDYLNCAFYASRFVAYAPEPFKSQIAPTAKFCYKKYHGADEGYDAVVTAAQANLTPPAGFKESVKPAPTPAEQIHGIITSTADLGTLAIADKEMVFQYGSPEDSAKVWETIKGKSVEIPGALVIASTPTQLQLAVSDDAKQSKTADFTVNLAAAEEPTTAAAKAAAARKADAMAVGKTVTVQGTYDSFTSTPLMITMSNGSVVLGKAAPARPAAHAPAHAPARRTAHR